MKLINYSLSTSKRDFVKQTFTLVMGRDACGKATWLKAAGAKFLEIESENLPHSVKLYQHNTGLYISCDHNYLSEVCTWLLKEFGKRRLKSVICVCDIESLQLKRGKRQSLSQIYQDDLRYLYQEFNKPLNLSIIFTYFDKLLGFQEFFASLPPSERAEPIKISFEKTDKTSFQHQYKIGFELLLKSLHERIIWQLHHERHVERRKLIRDFPLQFEELKSLIQHFCLELVYSDTTLKNAINLSHLFFVSGAQNGQGLDTITSLGATTANRKKDYFIRNSLNTIANRRAVGKPQPWQLIHDHIKLKHTTALAILIAALWAFSALWHNMQSSLDILSKTQKDIAQLQLLNEQQDLNQLNLLQTLPLLDRFSDAMQALNQIQGPWMRKQRVSLHHVLERDQQTLLIEDFLPHLLASLEKDLVNADPWQCYHALKTYLMFVDPFRRHTSSIIEWATHHWQKQFSQQPFVIQRLLTQLHHLLQLQLPGLPGNQALIAKARQQLNRLPTSMLGYLILKDQNSASLDEFYNPSTYAELGSSGFSHLVDRLNQDAWVLGPQDQLTKSLDIKTLSQQIQTLYLNDYANWWELKLSKITPKGFTDLATAQKTLQKYADPNSSIWRQLRTITQKTQSTAIQNPSLKAQFETDVSHHFNGLQAFFSDPNLLTALQQRITNLSTQLQSIFDSEDSQQAAWEFARQRFINTESPDDIDQMLVAANALSGQISTWFKRLALNTWTVVLRQSHDYLNQQWAPIYQQYQQNIFAHYPMENSSHQDISLSNFTKFFAPQGSLDTYYQHYLAPLIDTRDHWQPRERNGLILIEPALVESIEKAAVLQKAFFSGSKKLPYVRFALQAQAIEPVVDSVTLQLGGQLLQSKQSQYPTEQLHWPANKPIARIYFEAMNGQHSEITRFGPWAWFRLLDNTHQKRLSDDQHWQVTFDADGNAAKFILSVNNTVNPFTNHLWRQISLPKSV